MKNIILITCLTFSGCVVIPEKRYIYDKDCDIRYKQYTLKAEEYRNYQAHCNVSEECILALLFVPVTSLVISGSVVIVGNVVNWLEKEGACYFKNN